jgi:hypothetical protein
MSVRCELLFAAEKRILNPFLLCVLTSARVRQLLLASDGQAGLAELVDSALAEVAALGFEHAEPRRLSALVEVT